MKLEDYRSQFDKYISSLEGETGKSIAARQQAFDTFLRLGYPTKQLEAWQYTDTSIIAKTYFDLLGTQEVSISKDMFNDLIIPHSNLLVVVDGNINFKLSKIDKALNIKNIAETKDYNNFSFNIEDSPFIALNRAFADGGYLIEIADNYSSDNPLHLINIISNHKNEIQKHQINLIKVGKNSSVNIVEDFINLNSRKIFLNSINNVVLDENTNLRYSAYQNYSDNIIGLNHYYIEQSTNSNYTGQLLTKHGALIRNEIDIQINGENCDASVAGLGLLDNHDHIENFTNVIHNQANCNSKQLFKYILKDSAEGVFNGLVKVQPGAQQTDSQQTNKNILLSKKALMNSNPQLEIYADDVQCSHGSATGELDEEAIFYLRSRGLDLITAKALLIEGFAREIIDQIGVESFKKRITDELLGWLVK